MVELGIATLAEALDSKVKVELELFTIQVLKGLKVAALVIGLEVFFE